MPCPHDAPDCPQPEGWADVLHYRCFTCTRCQARRVTAMGSTWCTPCLRSETSVTLAYWLNQAPADQVEGARLFGLYSIDRGRPWSMRRDAFTALKNNDCRTLAEYLRLSVPPPTDPHPAGRA